MNFGSLPYFLSRSQKDQNTGQFTSDSGEKDRGYALLTSNKEWEEEQDGKEEEEEAARVVDMEHLV